MIVCVGKLVMFRVSRVICSAAVSSRSALTAANFIALKKRQAEQLQQLAHTEATLLSIRDAAVKQAESRADIAALAVFGYMCVQTGVLFHWVYQRFDWNLVEPITYLLGYATTWLCTYVYFMSGKEFTFDNMRATIVERRAKLLLKRQNFDEMQLAKIQQERATLEKALSKIDLANLE